MFNYKFLNMMVVSIALLSITSAIGHASSGVSIVDYRKSSWDQALIEAIQKGNKRIYFPKGEYSFEKGVTLKENGLSLYGEGTIVPKAKIARLFDIVGDNNSISLKIDGRNLIENGIRLKGNDVSVTNSTISNLHGFGRNSAIAIYIVSNGKFNVSGNTLNDIYAEGDGKGGNGIGMARGISVSRTEAGLPEQSLIQNNKINNVFGEEGDSITLHSKMPDGKYGALNVNVVENSINNFSRRAIKTQGSKVKILSNTITNVKDVSKTYNCSSAISVYTAIDTIIQGNHTKIEECGSVSVYMNKKHPNLSAASNIQVIDNTFETSSGNDVSLLGVSVAGGQLRNLRISGNRVIGDSKGFVIGKSKDAQISNNEITLRKKESSKSYIRTGDTRLKDLSNTNHFK